MNISSNLRLEFLFMKSIDHSQRESQPESVPFLCLRDHISVQLVRSTKKYSCLLTCSSLQFADKRLQPSGETSVISSFSEIKFWWRCSLLQTGALYLPFKKEEPEIQSFVDLFRLLLLARPHPSADMSFSASPRVNENNKNTWRRVFLKGGDALQPRAQKSATFSRDSLIWALKCFLEGKEGREIKHANRKKARK